MWGCEVGFSVIWGSVKVLYGSEERSYTIFSNSCLYQSHRRIVIAVAQENSLKVKIWQERMLSVPNAIVVCWEE